jgi:predicted O-methyltransferase YrrM
MSDIVEHPEMYFRQFIPPRDSLLLELEREAQQEEIPIIGPIVGELLYILVSASRAKRILELGTATGYSAIYLARACQSIDGSVLTLENDGAMAKKAQNNIQKAGLEKIVEIRQSGALEELASLNDTFDFIFIDIEKEDYIHALPHCERLLKTGGLLVADNVGFKDADDFNHSISINLKWRQISLFALLPLHSPENDGICIALRA